jgi:hypothetical protein
MVAGLACHRVGDEAAAKWFDNQLEALAKEFRSKAVCLDRPAGTTRAAPEWEAEGIVAWPVAIEDDVTPNTLPPANAKKPGELSLSCRAVQGQTIVLCLAVRPLHDMRGFSAIWRWDAAPAQLPVKRIMVYYNTSRGFGQIAYRVKPHTLREWRLAQLRRGVTREFMVQVPVPADAPAGRYRGLLTLLNHEGPSIRREQFLCRIPVHVEVHAVALDRETDYLMGFFGLMPPSLIPKEKRWEALDQTLAMLRAYGMNAVSGGPSWSLKGWKDGQPQIDFGEMDRFVALLRKHGFTRPINGYGGLRFRGLHDGYQKGKTGAKVEQASGLPYPEALMRAWKAVDAHARQADWPTIYYAMCDETRVRDVAERELDFMQAMARASAAFPQTVRTSGSYSVQFNQRPTDRDDLLCWHQRFFEALDISSLNLHDPSVMAEARKLGKEIHIYNQGRDRYSFGLYQ